VTMVAFEYNTSDPYVFNRTKPKKITTITQRAGKPAYSREAEYYYDSRSLLNAVIKDPNTSRAQYNIFSQDDFGNVVQNVLVATGVSPVQINTFQYSSDGRFMTQSENVLGHYEEYTSNLW